LKNTAEHHQETVTYLGQQGWDFAFGGEIGEEKDAYEPLYGLLRRRMETYRSDTEGQPDITLDGTKEDYEKLRKQYPHLSV